MVPKPYGGARGRAPKGNPVASNSGRKRQARARAAVRSPFQLELIRLIDVHRDQLGRISGRSLSARLGKSSNHLWQILNRGMVPSGAAILDIARLLALSASETEGLVLAAIETKGRTRSRDRFWITRVREMVVRRDAELREVMHFLHARGLTQAFSVWRRSKRGARKVGKARPGRGN
jgi:hypothetical protein